MGETRLEVFGNAGGLMDEDFQFGDLITTQLLPSGRLNGLGVLVNRLGHRFEFSTSVQFHLLAGSGCCWGVPLVGHIQFYSVSMVFYFHRLFLHKRTIVWVQRATVATAGPLTIRASPVGNVLKNFAGSERAVSCLAIGADSVSRFAERLADDCSDVVCATHNLAVGGDVLYLFGSLSELDLARLPVVGLKHLH